MRRRQFIGAALAGGAVASWSRALRQEVEPKVQTVLAMFKCHFDLGFIDTQAGVMNRYFEEYFPHAIEIAREMRRLGEDRYIWTTGSWLLYEYLEQANGEERRRMEQAVQEGDIAWHALPFTWQTELMDASMIAGAIGLSKTLDRRFGTVTTGAKMTDVPGHSRGLIAPLSENGVKFLDIGVNSASTPPEVPASFVWKDSAGKSLIVMYHHREYGGVVHVPGSDLAISVNVRDDNSGPHSVAEIGTIYGDLRRRFPNAKIRAANLTEIGNAVVAFQSNLPVLTQEIGDTWIYGAASDPVKVARYRELMRMRRQWIGSGNWQVGSDADVAFLRRFSLAVEHTWGTDTKTWLDFDHYTPHQLSLMLEKPHYQTVSKSWGEKRNDIEQGLQNLPVPLRQDAAARLAGLKPVPPALSALNRHDSRDLIETTHFVLGLDAETGAIRSLRRKSSDQDWGGQEYPIALFSYQTLSKEDYDRFLASYVTSKADWAPKDFGKPNIEHFGAQSRIWLPKMVNCWSGRGENQYRVIAQLRIDDAVAEHSGVVGWPERMYLELTLPDSEPLVQLNFYWFEKKPNRLPEALWLTFQPNAREAGNWTLEKVDQQISPFDVVPGGNRHMHAITKAIAYQNPRGTFSIETLDAPVLALGEKSPIYFSREPPQIQQGIHFSLFNNGWGTNYIQWFGEDMRFRFVLRG